MLTDAQARAVVAAGAFVVAVIVGTLAVGQAALNVVLAAGWLWLLADRAALHDRAARADTSADLAVGKAEAIEAHLCGLEPASSGRHRC